MLEFLSVIFENWKQVGVSFIILIAVSVAVIYQNDYRSLKREYETKLIEDTLNAQKQEKEYLEALSKYQGQVVKLQDELRKSENEKNESIKKLNNAITTLNNNTDSLYNETNRTEQMYTSEDYTSSQEQIRYINTINQLYREALKDGAESSEAVERTKVELKQCSTDIDNIYKLIEE